MLMGEMRGEKWWGERWRIKRWRRKTHRKGSRIGWKLEKKAEVTKKEGRGKMDGSEEGKEVREERMNRKS